MNGVERLRAVDRGTPAMASALPGLPMAETVMVRLLRIAVVGLGQATEPSLRRAGLTESNFHVLCLLMSSENGRASPSELSELVGASRANMSRIVDNLVSDGLILRETVSNDARRATLQITERGREVVRSAVPLLADPLHRAFAGLDRKSLAMLGQLLRSLVASFDAAIVSDRKAA